MLLMPESIIKIVVSRTIRRQYDGLNVIGNKLASRQSTKWLYKIAHCTISTLGFFCLAAIYRQPSDLLNMKLALKYFRLLDNCGY